MSHYRYTIPPRDYQRRALQLALRRKRMGIFFEMGTGKTKVAVDFFFGLHQFQGVSRVLVVAPLSVLGQWEDEIMANAPKKSFAFSVTYYLTEHIHESKALHIILLNYEKSWRNLGHLREWRPQIVVADESHRIKSPTAKQSKALWKLGDVAEYVLALTGTPIANRPLDLWSQFQFINPRVFDCKFRVFKYRYAVWGGYMGFQLIKYKNLEELSKRIRPWVMTLRKVDYLNLPKKTFIDIPIELPIKVRRNYDSMKRDFVAYVNKKVILAPIVLTKLGKMSQMSGGFINDEDGKPTWLHDAKVDALRELIKDFDEQEENRVVVFAHYIAEIDRIIETMPKPWLVCRIDGTIRIEDRAVMIREFQSPTKKKLAAVCQIATGSLGLNLMASHIIVFYSLDYSFSNYLQAADRIHRIGQKRPCLYYHLLAKATLDRRILGILRKKKSILDQVIYKKEKLC